jgi:hypothetical protein
MTSRQADERQDQTVEDSMPASDPPASTGITGPRTNDRDRGRRGADTRPPPPEARGEDARPKGTPTDERHATETAYQSESEEHPPQR